VSIIVQKYGGTSVQDHERLLTVARRVAALRNEGHDVVVVVSAMGSTTDGLLDEARRFTDAPAQRELDMLVTAGERISMSLLAIALNAIGTPAISFTGSQVGIITDTRHTDARILEVRPHRVVSELAKGNVVVVGGYQGVSVAKEVTTLGRGGSDTTAVALAAALEADRCEILTDVDAVHTADPRVVPRAARIAEISWEDMAELAKYGARIMKEEAVRFAERSGIQLHIARSDGSAPGTIVLESPRHAEPPIVGLSLLEGLRAVSCPAVDADAVCDTLTSERAEAVLTVLSCDGLTVIVDEGKGRKTPLNRGGGVAALCAVGRDAGTPATLRGLTAALRAGGIDVIAAVSGGRSVKVVVPGDQGRAALKTAHELLIAA
jgi:aspartate kinase